jgi:hypothetical protein
MGLQICHYNDKYTAPDPTLKQVMQDGYTAAPQNDTCPQGKTLRSGQEQNYYSYWYYVDTFI